MGLCHREKKIIFFFYFNMLPELHVGQKRVNQTNMRNSGSVCVTCTPVLGGNEDLRRTLDR